jgi:hypothetical protein
MPESATDPFEAFTGDVEGGRLLRANLARLADQLAGTPLGDRVAASLAGRGDLRSLTADPEFAALVHEGTRQLSVAWDGLDREQRREVVAQGRRMADLDDEPTELDEPVGEQPIG